MQRKPSHFGSYSHAGPSAGWAGTPVAALASIGETGGFTGRSMWLTLPHPVPLHESERAGRPGGLVYCGG
ncbi:hypothetical protein GCM10027519_11580 [Kineococcus endophyticus]